MANVKPIPDGFTTLTPYLIVGNADAELAFLEKAFGAQPTHLARMPDGTIMHVSMKLGTSMLMMGQAGGPWKPMPSCVYMYVPDVDATYQRALDAGAKSVQEPKDQFYGDRTSGVEDANGNMWWIGTHIEDVSEEELQRRSKQFAPAAQ